MFITCCIIIGILYILFKELYISFKELSSLPKNNELIHKDNKELVYEDNKNYFPIDLTYENLLLKDEWKTKRESILQRDNYKCKWCGSTYNLQVHHKYYSKYPNNEKAMPWNYPDDALITLCDKCHKKAHNKKIKTYYRKYSDNY